MQMDIGGLIGLMGNMGARGLKCLAMAGVDPHTIGSMLMISETCSASTPYRRHLSSCRDDQRKQQMWLYKVVEVGAATNFVADELLKTRAGENVIALLSSILPMLEDEACDTILMQLFQTCSIEDDHIPGLAQLRRLRQAIQPLVVKTKFKDRLLLYHKWFSDFALDWLERGKAENSTEGSEGDLAYARSKTFTSQPIPNEPTMARLIHLLYKLMQEDPSTILVYDGIAGAAWVFAYCIDVLGLPTCVLTTRIGPRVLHGDPRTAKVLIYICATSDSGAAGRCELRRAGEVEDCLRIGTFDSKSTSTWAVDALETRMLDLFSPAASASPLLSAHLAGCLMRRMTEILCTTLQGEDLGLVRPSNESLLPYPLFCQTEIQHRATSILKRLGFNPKGLELWKEAPEEWPGNPACWIGISSPRSDSLGSPTQVLENAIQAVPNGGGIGPEPLVDPTWHSFTAAGEMWLYAILKAVDFASTLAFTNWGEAVYAISVAFINHDHQRLKHNLLRSTLARSLIHQTLRSSEQYSMPLQSLFQECVWKVLGDGRDVRRMKFGKSLENVLAESIRGTIVMRSHSVFQEINLKGNYLSFFPGIIRAGEEQRKYIKAGIADSGMKYTEIVRPNNRKMSFSDKDIRIQRASSKSAESAQKESPRHVTWQRKIKEEIVGVSLSGLKFEKRPPMSPSNDFEDLVVRSEIILVDDSVEVELRLEFLGEVIAMIDPLAIAASISTLRITKDCEHSYYQPYSFQTLPVASFGNGIQPRLVTVWQEGLSFESHRRERDRQWSKLDWGGAWFKAYTQTVDKSPAGQWVACQWTASRNPSMRILQKGRCLECTVSAFVQRSMMRYLPTSEFCIINGRLPGEPCEPPVTHDLGESASADSRSELSLPPGSASSLGPDVRSRSASQASSGTPGTGPPGEKSEKQRHGVTGFFGFRQQRK